MLFDHFVLGIIKFGKSIQKEKKHLKYLELIIQKFVIEFLLLVLVVQFLIVRVVVDVMNQMNWPYHENQNVHEIVLENSFFIDR